MLFIKTLKFYSYYYTIIYYLYYMAKQDKRGEPVTVDDANINPAGTNQEIVDPADTREGQSQSGGKNDLDRD